MNINELISKASMEEREQSAIYHSYLDNERIIIKKTKQNELDEKDIIAFLKNEGIDTYEIINSAIDESENYIIYKYIIGEDGFSVERNIDFFFDLGKLIGRMHSALIKYSLEKNKSMKEIIHGDLHSGNIIKTSKGLSIIDFSEVKYEYQSIDLLNIGYEIANEKDKRQKENSFIEGYRNERKISYPSKEYVLHRIKEADRDEYNRMRKRKIRNIEYFNKLEYAVKNDIPTFVPGWI